MSNIRYRRLAQQEATDETDTNSTSNEDFQACQFERLPVAIPWKAIAYAAALLLLGSLLLGTGCLIVAGYLDPETHNERFWPLILLGSLLFIPGSYHTYFAYKAYSGDPDWAWEEFPDF